MGQSERTGLPILLTRLVVLPTTTIADGAEAGEDNFESPFDRAPDDEALQYPLASQQSAHSRGGAARQSAPQLAPETEPRSLDLPQNPLVWFARSPVARLHRTPKVKVD
jgi:hypothetical protein